MPLNRVSDLFLVIVVPRKDLPFIDVYFPEPGGEQQKIRWEEKAKKNAYRAAFIREAVEFYMREADSSRQHRADAKLLEDNRKLRDELKLRSLPWRDPRRISYGCEMLLF